MKYYITKETLFHNYSYCPNFIFNLKLSESAKIIYIALLNRSKLSQNIYDNWHDDDGKIYIYFKYDSLAKYIGKSISTVRNALRELRAAGLIETVKQFACKPSKIYVKIPQNYCTWDEKSNMNDLETDNNTYYYIKKSTCLINYSFFPNFLFAMNITDTAKIVYAALLGRTRLSQKNYINWQEPNGNIYINFTYEKLSQLTGKSISTIKNTIHELKSVGLIETKQDNIYQPSKIFLKIPKEYITFVKTTKNPTSYQTDIDDDDLPF